MPTSPGQPFRLRSLRRALKHVKGLADRIWITRASDIAQSILTHPGGRLT
jgi:hypothetical protein